MLSSLYIWYPDNFIDLVSFDIQRDPDKPTPHPVERMLMQIQQQALCTTI